MAQISSIKDYFPHKTAAVAKSAVEALLADARRRLVETGTRNRLVHTPRGAKRTRSLPIIRADADSLFEALTRGGPAMRFVPGDDEPSTALTLANTPRPAGRGGVLQTNLATEPLAKRLLTIYRDAKTAEEEQGINILFLAIGFLHWYEDDKSEVLREAPLILVPVSLVRDTLRSTFDLHVHEEDIVTNQAIQERLRTDFGISFPDLPESEDWLPTKYFASVREAIVIKPRWSIDPHGAELGFYSFSKLLMIRDLEPAVWENKGILEHELLRALLAEGFKEEPAALSSDARLDRLFGPADLIQVVDADSSQTIVIETVRSGQNLVVQGPPGTGKSQTITNVIASAVHDGKTVLFVAEKMAALDVVHSRLRKVGLGAICLELHSRGANKRAVLSEVADTLAVSASAPDAYAEVTRLLIVRNTLNEAAERLHAPIGETGLTPFQAMSRLMTAADTGIKSLTALLPEASKWSAGDYTTLREATERLSEMIAATGPILKHPYYGTVATTLQPAEFARLHDPLTVLIEAAQGLGEVTKKVANFLGLPGEPTLETCATIISILRTIETLPHTSVDLAEAIAGQRADRIMQAVRTGMAFTQHQNKLTRYFIEAAWDIPARPLRAELTTGLSFFGRFGGRYRGASKTLASVLTMPLPRKAQARIELADRLISLEKTREALQAEHAAMETMIPLFWRREQTDFAALNGVAVTVHTLMSLSPAPRSQSVIDIARRKLAAPYIGKLEPLMSAVKTAAEMVFDVLQVETETLFSTKESSRIPLHLLAARAFQWRESQARFDEWRRLAAAHQRLRASSATALASALATGAIVPEQALPVLECSFAEAVWSKAVASTPALHEFYGPRHDALVDEFRKLEKKRLSTTVDIIRGRHAAQVPRGNLGAMGIIRSEMTRKRGHRPIRQLIKHAGETLQRIKPVFLMSPISVAQYLPPGAVAFDLLVIDEASQVRPEEALGLVARAKQIVVVGDNKQLPPTSFFDRIVADEEDQDDENEEAGTALAGAAKATDMESILALCEARGLNSAMLRWHYRSRHPSLIEVSNAEFYKHLIMPPAPSAERVSEGLMFRRVAGAYDRGGKRTNQIEAEAVVNEVARHAKESAHLTLGIVTFSTAQRDLINELLEFKRRNDAALDGFLREGKAEDVFVKNLENVQGDERDVILISVGYGPRTAGTPLDSMGLGPVSGEGGERRLNVLFTRARSRCEVFCSFAAGDIDPARAKGEGARVLKRFLNYAETGILEERVSTSEDADSPFEEMVAGVIESLGYQLDKQVGSAGFKIDMAVRHPVQPGRYMLAVECDGATYHSALWARERDRLRQEVLENLGWRFHRIWSTDWFYRRGEAVQKLQAALDEARDAVVVVRKIQPTKSPEPNMSSMSSEPFDLPTTIRQMPAYRLASCSVPRGVEPHQARLQDMAAITRHIVETEGPVHQDEVARRVASLFGKLRTGSLISDASLRSLNYLKSAGKLIEDRGFWLTQDQLKNPPVRDRSAAPLSLQKAEMLAPLEIKAAAKIAEQENGTLTDEDMVVAVTRIIGFKRAGPELKIAILASIKR